MRSRNRHQLVLPLDVTLDPPACPESEKLYRAVLAHRGNGLKVYRAGTGLHAFDGSVVSTHQLIVLARVE